MQSKITDQFINLNKAECHTCLPDISKGKVILYAEDDPVLRNLTPRLLEGRGYKVLSAGNGVEAEKVAEAYGLRNIDLMITDMMMPFMNGKELADKLSMKEPKLQILVVSSCVETEEIQEWLALNDFHFLQKPVRLETLLNKMKEIFEITSAGSTDSQERQIA